MKIDSMGDALAYCQEIMPGMKLGLRLNEVAQEITYNDEKYLMMFKREYYQNFKYHFPNIKKDNGKNYGWAQIMSKSLLDYACKETTNIDWILCVTPDGKAYKCPPMLFKRFSTKHGTDVPHLQGEVAMPLDMFDALKRR